jgi:hypothetical protein
MTTQHDFDLGELEQKPLTDPLWLSALMGRIQIFLQAVMVAGVAIGPVWANVYPLLADGLSFADIHAFYNHTPMLMSAGSAVWMAGSGLIIVVLALVSKVRAWRKAQGVAS